MLKIESLRFAYGKHHVLNGVSLSLEPGQVGVLCGRNGAGKTTLLGCMLGFLKPSSGAVTLDGNDVLSMNVRRRAGLIACVPQDIRFGALSVRDSVLLGRLSGFGFRPSREDHRAAERVLDEMGLTALADRNVLELSGGERQKVAVARAVVQEPRLLLFDEPTASLDLANEQLILREAQRLAHERGICVLMTLHDLNQALSIADGRLFFMKDGTVAYDAAPEGVTEGIIRDIYGVDAHIITAGGRPYMIGG